MGISIDRLAPEPISESARDLVDRFVRYESQLADEFRLAEWEALWADDAIYWVPIGWDGYDPAEKVSLIYEDRRGIAGRIARLSGNADYAEEPRSRVRRILGERQITALGSDEYQSAGNFVLGSFRKDTQTVWAGMVRHRIRISGNTAELVEKVVWLLNSDGFVSGLSFLL